MANNEKLTDDLKKKGIQEFIKKMEEAELQDEHPISGRKGFTETNDDKKNSPKSFKSALGLRRSSSLYLVRGSVPRKLRAALTLLMNNSRSVRRSERRRRPQSPEEPESS